MPLTPTLEKSGTLQILAGIWKDVLQCDHVGLDDDFFEMGGNSLSAFELCVRIDGAYGISLPVTTLLRAPTVRALGNTVDFLASCRQGANGSDDGDWVVPFRTGTGGGLTPMFALHGGLLYREMFEQLATKRSVFLVDPPRVMEAPLQDKVQSMEEAAALYVEQILRAQPSGPFVLMGYSTGGVLAWETARQLGALGHVVEALLLIDTCEPLVEAETSATLGAWVAFHWRRNARHAFPARLAGFASDVWGDVVLKVKHLWAVQRGRRIAPREAIPSESQFLVFEKALAQYQTGALEAPVYLFRAEHYKPYPATLGWEKFAGKGMTVIPIRGGHTEIFEAPYVAQLASELKNVLLTLP